jgi:S-adenosylmethionine:tRNA ribosyltransferase-isomerase
MDFLSRSTYLYELPEELIAQYPCSPRDRSRLMVIDRSSGLITEMVFCDLVDFVKKDDTLVFNDTKVIPARLIGRKNSGAILEVFLLERQQDGTWTALTKPAKKVHIGTTIFFSDTFKCEVLEDLPEGAKRIRFHYEGDFNTILAQHGQMPLPPYIRRSSNAHDENGYQTIFAKNPGAVAAPTAALHFSSELVQALAAKGVSQINLTLHVGIGTFRPVQTEDIRQHVMHAKRYEISSETALKLNSHQKKNRQICVGTTTCRTLEFACNEKGKIKPGFGSTDIFIYPGYTFKYVSSLLTNFHLPGSTLLMLVCAFAGYDLTMEAYAKAIKDRYRFYSYGDAMLIL